MCVKEREKVTADHRFGRVRRGSYGFALDILFVTLSLRKLLQCVVRAPDQHFRVFVTLSALSLLLSDVYNLLIPRFKPKRGTGEFGANSERSSFWCGARVPLEISRSAPDLSSLERVGLSAKTAYRERELFDFISEDETFDQISAITSLDFVPQTAYSPLS